MDRYLYMVNPRIPLKICNETVRRSKNLELTKDEVKHALKHGPVYRKFDAKTMDRVTLQNIDSLHVKTKGEVENTVVENITVEEAVTPIVDLPVEETVTITKEEVIKPDVIIYEETEATTEEVVEKELEAQVEEDTETVSEETTAEEVEEKVEEVEQVSVEQSVEARPEQRQFTNNYYKKKKRNR